jgi:sugar phosphate isomerase/epimerase
MRFGISTHLFHDRRLQREHLAQVAAYGFESIELFATRSHFDYHDPSAIDALAGWLRETGLRLHGVHAPITDAIRGNDWGGTTYSTAAADSARRQAAVREADAALKIAGRIPFDVLVVHLGVPSTKGGAADNSRAAAIRSAEEIGALAEAAGVRVAFEVIPNDLSSPAALVSLIEKTFDAPHVGICLDFGHAHIMGDVVDAVETAAEHLVATHVHDNGGRSDDHLVPWLGSIPWDAALLSMQKIGYDGTYLMEVANTGSTSEVLEEARRARQRFERALTHA